MVSQEVNNKINVNAQMCSNKMAYHYHYYVAAQLVTPPNPSVKMSGNVYSLIGIGGIV